MEKKKKIALFSCHDDPNYGSMLQAYALAAVIRTLGHEPEYISYNSYPHRPLFLQIAICVAKKLGIRRTAYDFSFFDTSEFATTMEAFGRFHSKYIPHSAKVYYSNTIQHITETGEYENYIVGSDQTWSPYLYNPRKPYFLDFASLPKRNAYAPSLGTTKLPEEYQQLLKKKLSIFNNISCREYANCKLLSSLTGKDVCCVLDPTLLLTPKEWDKVCKLPAIDKEYILAYILGEKDSIVSFAEHLGKTKKLPVYYIATRPKHLNHPNTLTGVGPDDFAGLIKNARYVVTDSFHGSLFSVNYNVQFYAFSKRDGDLNCQDNIRILEFLQSMHLENRLQDDRSATVLPDVDYEMVNKKLCKMREKSIVFLKSCLE